MIETLSYIDKNHYMKFILFASKYLFISTQIFNWNLKFEKIKKQHVNFNLK